ncbi:transposase IS116/IS110/IS902 family protein [Calidifontibacter indicus]|uniref:Transposase IS116/IS110/IS902 family protein n=1 Tax=Calidifontibacter indicus TaxID=419650 RepID=A0A3D9UI20_9MICO|nr:transposase IS116/IS110/IS902 family protein [Calidifontibacter indicus]
MIAAWRASRTAAPSDPLAIARREARRLAIARREARRLAIVVVEHGELLKQNHRELHQLAEAPAPGLQDQPGVGPVTAAIIICAYSHHGRVRSEAAFAALGGIAPVPASSGNTERHRLSRSGDRQLNRAFDVIVRTQMSYDEPTRDYVARRRTEGRSNREIRRCLKRYVCRAIFRELQTTMA